MGEKDSLSLRVRGTGISRELSGVGEEMENPSTSTPKPRSQRHLLRGLDDEEDGVEG
eukprot:CAMPEP_0173448376 /NCGR_PEP_ID=MMETSP1357-20121228/40640_1 /TAXON_ID=77926 /ORGANISM="Hemiselmis rufescens, Strain PCC563" /LENGTH=56 /DNA_ID=CAMNT_0014414879 /DNA_START=34 /DNA_END=200 /DNA_ORIENTATION=-